MVRPAQSTLFPYGIKISQYDDYQSYGNRVNRTDHFYVIEDGKERRGGYSIFHF